MVTEVEIDILTGTHLVNRVDIIEDVGQSLSPLVDIGQIEGAFVMGMGYWTTENLIFNKEGRLLTDSTWDYKVPGALDIPVDLRVQIPKNNPNPVGVLFSKGNKTNQVFLKLDNGTTRQLSKLFSKKVPQYLHHVNNMIKTYDIWNKL